MKSERWNAFIRFTARRIREERASNSSRAAVAVAEEFTVPETPHSDHAHRLLLREGARVCPACGLYIFNTDLSIAYRCLNKRADAAVPPCPMCEVGS